MAATMALLALVSLIWAFSFGLIKRYLTVLDPAFVAFARLFLALLTFASALRLRPGRRAVPLRLAAIGMVQFGLMYLAYIAAFRRLGAHQVALLTLTTPVLVCLCAVWPARKLSAVALLAAGLSLLGAALALSPHRFGNAQWSGVLLIQFSNLCFATGQVAYRHHAKSSTPSHHRGDMAWLYLGGTVATAPIAFWGLRPNFQLLTAPRAAVLLYLGVIASGVGFYLWNRGATQVRSAELAVMNNAKTPLAVAVSLLVFREQANIARLSLGIALMLVAAILASRAARD